MNILEITPPSNSNHSRDSTLLGHGPTYRIDRPDEAFPHNLFLSTWLYTGIVGLTLLLAYLAAVLRQALKAPPGLDRILRLAILLHLLICAMTDFSQVVKGPGPMWYMLWLSTLLCATKNRPPACGTHRATA